MLDDRPVREKFAYEAFMYGHIESITIDGTTFTYPEGQRDDSYRHAMPDSQQKLLSERISKPPSEG